MRKSVNGTGNSISANVNTYLGVACVAWTKTLSVHFQIGVLCLLQAEKNLMIDQRFTVIRNLRG